MALYKAVLHHPRNKLPEWFLEAVGVLVSRLNGCGYCDRHHTTGPSSISMLISIRPRFSVLAR